MVVGGVVGRCKPGVVGWWWLHGNLGAGQSVQIGPKVGGIWHETSEHLVPVCHLLLPNSSGGGEMSSKQEGIKL